MNVSMRLSPDDLTGYIVPLWVEQSKKFLKPGHHEVGLRCYGNQDVNFSGICACLFVYCSKFCHMAHSKETPKIYFHVYRAKSSSHNQNLVRTQVHCVIWKMFLPEGFLDIVENQGGEPYLFSS